jgi:hypothetical protein
VCMDQHKSLLFSGINSKLSDRGHLTIWWIDP